MNQRAFFGRVGGALRPARRGARGQSRRAEPIRLEALEARQLLAAAVTANPDIYVALQATPLNVAAPGVLGNDAATSGAALTVASFTQPADGTLTLNPNGSFRYTPKAGYTGPDQFTYVAADATTGGTATTTVRLAVNATTAEASVFAGPRLAGISTEQGTLLNAVLGGLVGANLDLTAGDYDGLAAGSVNGGRLADALGAELGVTPGRALTTNATLGQVFTAAATAATADGDTADAAAFTNLAASVAGLTAPVQLGNLIQANPNDGSLAGASFNDLDLVNGTAQLFNFGNVATTPTPITVSGASLGLPGVVGTVAISAQVVEPPILTTGPVGTRFHSSAIRLLTNLNLADNLNTTALAAALAGPLSTALGGVATPAATASLTQLAVYTEVAEGQGTIAGIDALANSVTLQATPGVADAYIGTIDPAVFFNRARALDPATDLAYGNVGTLDITASVLGAQVLNQAAGIQVRSQALGAAPAAATEVFNTPFPRSQTVSSGAAFLTNLANTLATNLSVRTSGSLGAVLDPLVNTTILPALTPIVTNAVTPLVAPVLTGVADPALQDLGTGIGELALTVNAVNQVAAPAANADTATTLEDVPVAVPVLANDATIPGQAVTVSAVTQPAHGTAAINADGTIAYTPAAGYFGPDNFTYTITDPSGLASTGTVAVDVTPLPPVALADTYTGAENAALTIPAASGVLANDTDPNGTALTAVIATRPTRGTVTLNADGSFTYTPTAGDFGPDTFTYRAVAGTALSAPVAVTVNVQAAPPVALPDAYTATAGQPLTVPAASGVLANDTDPNGTALTAVVATQPAHGAVTLNADGSFTYTPAAGYVGPDSFTYQASDGTNRSTAVAVALTVDAAATPSAPTVIGTFPVTGTQGVPITNTPLVTFTDGAGTNPAASYNATINWGDGSAPSTGVVTEANGVYQVAGSHTYAQSGSFPVSIAIASAGSAGTSATTTAAISPAAANASLSGAVYADANGDGVREANEAGVAGATITLAGSTTAGQPIYYVTRTALDGSYSFAGLPAGTYAIAEAMANGTIRTLATTTVGQASAGSLGGTAGNRLITGINLPAGGAGTGYNFAEAGTSAIGGTVYLDYNRNGQDDANEFGVANVVITLTGTAADGQAVSMTATTDSSGRYEFANLATGTYRVKIARPAALFNKGAINVGTDGGTVAGESVAGIDFTAGTAATGYNFGELVRPGCRLNTATVRSLLQAGPAATTLPATARAVTFPANGPVARYLPTLAALAANRAAVATQQVHAKAHAVHPVHAAATHHVKVQHAQAKPHAATARRHK